MAAALDGLEMVVGEPGTRPPQGGGLDHDPRQGVGHRVVQIAGDAKPLQPGRLLRRDERPNAGSLNALPRHVVLHPAAPGDDAEQPGEDELEHHTDR